MAYNYIRVKIFYPMIQENKSTCSEDERVSQAARYTSLDCQTNTDVLELKSLLHERTTYVHRNNFFVNHRVLVFLAFPALCWYKYAFISNNNLLHTLNFMRL